MNKEDKMTLLNALEKRYRNLELEREDIMRMQPWNEKTQLIMQNIDDMAIINRELDIVTWRVRNLIDKAV